MFFAKSTGWFYDEAHHGVRKFRVAQPGWVHPEIEIPDPAWDVEAHPGEVHPTVTIPDPAVTPPLVEIDNPDCKIPSDAVEISDASHRLLLKCQSEGKIIVADAEGYPVVADPLPPTAEQVKATRTAQIKAALAELDAKSIRPLRDGDAARLADLEAQAVLLRSDLAAL